jgi:SAM-dependent methyltransferase
MRYAFLADILFPTDARVLEVGCGTGVLTRALARGSNIRAVVGVGGGVDVAPSLLGKARAGRGSDQRHLLGGRRSAFALRGRNLRYRRLRLDVDPCTESRTRPHRGFPGAGPLGSLAAFDGDYATTTVALGDHDSLQACADAMMANSVHDRWLGRRLPALVRGGGFDIELFRS